MAGAYDRLRTPPELVVAALVGAASLPLARLFRTGGIVPTILASIALSALLAWGLRRRRIFAPLAAAISTIAWFAFIGLVFFRDSLWVVVPSHTTFSEIGGSIASGIRLATTEVAPVAGSTELLVLVSMIVWALMWLADDAVHKLRHPLLAIGFTMPVFIFPGTLIDSRHRWLDTSLFIAAALAVLFVDETSRLARWGRTAGLGRAGWKPGLAARIGTFVIVAALALAPLVPGYADPPGGGSGGDGAAGRGERLALNPLVSIQPRLRRTPETPLFVVESNVPAYWRITALDSFNGFQWTAPTRRATRLVSNRTVAVDVPEAAGRTLVRQRYTIRGLGGEWLPASFEPTRVAGRGGVRMEPVTRSLVPADRIRPGQTYTTLSSSATPSPEQLDAVSPVSMRAASLAPFLLVPQAIPDEVVAEARRITADAQTPFRKAIALQNHLRSFVYDESVARGHSFRTLGEFLFETRRGYCEQFAGSMAVLARVVGIPARVAIGFAVGEPSGPNTYEVTSRHAHAWVELYFPGFGWLPFEPTPRSDGATLVPAYTQPDAVPNTPPPTEAPTASPSPTTAPTGPENPRLPEGEDAFPGLDPNARRGSVWRTPLVVAGAVLIVLAALFPGAAAARRRLRRRRAAASPPALAMTYYADFLEWCAAAGIPRLPGETPAEFSRRLARRADEATDGTASAQSSGGSESASPAVDGNGTAEPLDELASMATETLWSPSPHPDPARVARAGAEARRVVAPTLPRRARLRQAFGWGWWRPAW